MLVSGTDRRTAKTVVDQQKKETQANGSGPVGSMSICNRSLKSLKGGI